MRSTFSAFFLALLLAATSSSAPSDKMSLAKRNYSWDHGNCGHTKHLKNGVQYVFELGPWGPDHSPRILSGCWACFGQSGQAGQGWHGTAGAVMRDTLSNVNFYNKWKVHVHHENEISLSITGDGQTMYLGAGSNMGLPNGDPRANAVINDVEPFRLKYLLTRECKIRFYVDGKGVLGRCGSACENYGVQHVNSPTEAMHFWGDDEENNQGDRPARVDFNAVAY